MPKNFGNITDDKDITTKEYVDTEDQRLDEVKLEEDDLDEVANTTVQDLWNRYMGDNPEEVSPTNIELSTDIESDKNSDTKAATPRAVYEYVSSIGITSQYVDSLWIGSQLEYDSLTTKSPKTLYFITG